MLSNKVSLSSLLISSVLCSSVTFVVCYGKLKHSSNKTLTATSNVSTSTKESTVFTPSTSIVASSQNASCGIIAHRLSGYKYIKPLLYGDKTCETGNLSDLKQELVTELENDKQLGILDNGSVYLKLLEQGGEYICINEGNLYHPGSLIKLPILITYMSMEEKNPGLLNKQLLFENPKGGLPNQTFNSNSIQPGKSYTIKELLKYMVAYSDNNATYLLNRNVDIGAFEKLFTDVGLTVPDPHDLSYQISAKDYSAFLKVIYNAGYLTIPNSEFVAELLAQCDFKLGIENGLPANVELAHKFGEWGDKNKPDFHQLSESGIVYLNNSPYLLTVMTQGKDVKRLPEVISAISKITFNKIKAKETKI